MFDKLDVPMHDADVLDEIEMTSNLMIAASEADGALSQSAVDDILGLPTETTTTGSSESTGPVLPHPRHAQGAPSPSTP